MQQFVEVINPMCKIVYYDPLLILFDILQKETDINIRNEVEKRMT